MAVEHDTSAPPAQEPRAADVLDDLAARGATGLLQVRGKPGAHILLHAGEVVTIEAAAAPPLPALLIESGLVEPAAWQTYQETPPTVAPVRHPGGLTDLAWRQICRYALLDAADRVLPVSGPVVFQPMPVTGWRLDIPPTPLAGLSREVRRRAAVRRRIRHLVTPESRPSRMPARMGSFSLTRRQWALVTRCEGQPLRHIAPALGVGVFEAMIETLTLLRLRLLAVEGAQDEAALARTARTLFLDAGQAL